MGESKDLSLRVVAVGDTQGVALATSDEWRAREVIVWMIIGNKGNTSKLLLPEQIWFRVDDGDWRRCFYHRWSIQIGQIGCSGVKRPRWRHAGFELGPGKSVAVWGVFRLPKHQYDDMSRIWVEYRKEDIKVEIEVSPDRVPLDLPYIIIDKPREGEEVWTLRDVKFRVVDSDITVLGARKISVNWSIQIDGVEVKRGRAEHPDIPVDICPIVVETSLGSLDLGRGEHVFTVVCWNSLTNESASVNFTGLYEKPSISLLSERWAINTSNIFEGMVFGGGQESCQTVWDLDGDGSQEILFSNRRGHSSRLWCFSPGLNRLEWVYPSLEEEGLPGTPLSKVSLVDVDGDRIYELCLAGLGGRLHVLDGDGHLVWQWEEPKGGGILGAPQALDVDGDGSVEFFLNTNNGYLHRVSHEAETLWSFPTTAGNPAHPTICDIDRDGSFDVIWASQDGQLYCVDAGTGREYWRVDLGAGMERNNVIVADIDNDGEYEALTWAGSPTSGVVCIDALGRISWVWRLPRGGNLRHCQLISDIDQDGSMDMVVMSTYGAYGIEIGGSRPFLKWELNFTALSQSQVLPEGGINHHSSSYHLVADIDGDGDLEVLWLVPYPVVTDASTGKIEAYYVNTYLESGRSSNNGGWWGDIEGDGVSEWICELRGHTYAQTQTYSLTLGSRYPADSPWPEYYHCAYPAEYQWNQDWLTLKGAYSNSLWFPVLEALTTASVVLASLVGLLPWRGRKRGFDRG